MDPFEITPPAAHDCLVLSYASRGQRGGTLIAEEVRDVASHEARMKEPASYRPEACACGCRRLHVHDRRIRKVRGLSPLTVMVFLCSGCWASWRVLPAFVPRLLRSTWETVEAVTQVVAANKPQPVVPQRTARRWLSRLAQSARVPAQVLVAAGSAALTAVAQAIGLNGSRRALAETYAVRFATTPLEPLAVLLHRLTPGIRLI